MNIKLDESLPHPPPSDTMSTLFRTRISSGGTTTSCGPPLKCRPIPRTQVLDFSDARKYAPGTHHGLLLSLLLGVNAVNQQARRAGPNRSGDEKPAPAESRTKLDRILI